MHIGLFLPTASNGWIISKNAPQFDPDFPMMLDIVQRAEGYGIGFALAMVKLHGFGGATGFWDVSLDAFTLVAGLAARTERIHLIPSTPILALPPAICARMVSTLDSIAPGRISLNIVTGWQKAEYAQMGLWPDFYGHRYVYAGEYAQVLKDLWETGNSDFKGDFFKMEACKLEPRPSQRVPIVCAGQSDDGIEFCATYGDYNFIANSGINEPRRIAPIAEKIRAASEKNGRKIGALVATIVIAAETDEEAFAKWEHYREGIDTEALAWMVNLAKASAGATATSSINAARTAMDVNMGTGALIGSYGNVARMLDEIGRIPGVDGVMLELDDWQQGLDDFGTRIRPLMQTLTVGA